MRFALSCLALAALFGCPAPPGPDAGVVDAGVPGVLLGACGVAAGELAAPFAVVDLGHGGDITCLQKSGQFVVSIDSARHWVLWRGDGLRLAAGQTSRDVAGTGCSSVLLLRGETLAFLEDGAPHIRVHSATTGAALATLPAGASWGVSEDGSFLWVGSPTGLEVFSPAGSSLFLQQGDYSSAKGFGVAGELRMAHGSTLERFAMPGGTRTDLGSFSGTFSSWFLDGSHFVTSLGTTLWVYSADGMSQVVFGGLGSGRFEGRGDFFWRFMDSSRSLDLFKVDAGVNPVQSLPSVGTVISAGDSIGLFSDRSQPFRVVRLAPSGVTTTTVSHHLPCCNAFGANDQGEWVVGAGHGGLWNQHAGALVPLGCGNPMSITGAETGLAAIATGSGVILLVDLRPDGGHRLRPGIEFYSSQVELSADGQHLAAAGSLVDAQGWDDRSLRLYDPANGVLDHRWNYTWAGEYPARLFSGFSFARDGTRLSHLVRDVTTSNWVNSSVLTDRAGNTLATSQTNGLMRLSPDGQHGFVSVQGTTRAATTTELFTNGALTGAVAGQAVGWISPDRVLVNVYRHSGPTSSFVAAEIRDTGGALIEATTLPPLEEVSPSSGSAVYDAFTNATWDLATGQKLWESVNPRPYRAAPAGGFAVYQVGSVIHAEPW